MLLDQKYIHINASPEKIFGLIETMPNKFPVYKVLEIKPFLFIRMLFTDGFFSARKAMYNNTAAGSFILDIGDSMGPFKLTELKRPTRYWFTVNSKFMNCRTGYTLSIDGNRTKLNFDIIAEDPKSAEKIYWFLIKPFHHILAKKVLKVIKALAESK